MPLFDEELSRLVRKINSLGGETALPPVPRDRAGRLRLDRLLARAVETGASDLLLVPGVPPTARVDGRLIAVDPQILDARTIRALVQEILDERAAGQLDLRQSADFCFDRPPVGRFRCNVHHQRGSVAAAIRVFPDRILGLQELGLPASLEQFAGLERGLVLVCGPAGCGKSTTLAALVDLINRTRNAHVISVEDPVEYLHAHGTSVIEQLEVRRDTPSFHEAIRSVLRQDPDVIVVGEMRDLETMSMVLTAAETGHLVLSSLHTGTAAQTLDRIMDAFPEDRQTQVRAQLAMCLSGIVVQHLLPRLDRRGRVPAVEVLIANDGIRNLIRRGLIHQIPAQMGLGRGAGSVGLDESLARLARAGLVSREEARRRAIHPEEFDGFLG